MTTIRVQRKALLVMSCLVAAAVSVSAPLRSSLADQFTCTPQSVSTFEPRIHVRCIPSDGAIEYFAVNTDNSGNANRFLSLVSTALALSKKLAINYDANDQSGDDFGCDPANCRIMTGAMMF
jgi:hypothetical protein